MPSSKPLPGATAICGMLLLLGACSRGPLPETPLTAANLPADTFTVRTDRDTTLQTAGGASIRLPAGSLVPESGTTGRLVVREAYTLGRMLRGGLVTLSGSDIISAGGVIGLEPGAGTKRTLAKPLSLSLPAGIQKSGMQVWRDTGSRQRRFGWQLQFAQTGPGPVELPALGWAGAGTLIRDLPDFENSQLLARFSGTEQDGISVYLLLPSDGIVLEGGPAVAGAGSYAFYRNNGTVPLRRGQPALILGVKKKGTSWLSAMKTFTAAAEQEIRLELRPTTLEALNQALDELAR